MPVSPARAAAFDVLLRIEQQDAYASELLHSERINKLSSPDRHLVTELVMGVLRWQSRLDWQIARASMRGLEKLDQEVVTAMRLGAYQLEFLTRIPARAAIFESVELVKRARKRSAAPFVNAILRKLAARSGETASSDPTSAAALAHAFAHPEWIVERWVTEFGPQNARRICEHDQQVPSTAIWLADAQAESELLRDGVQLAPGGLLTRARVVVAGDVTATKPSREGRVFIQDEASQLVAALLGSGNRILDCCAAPGGKTAAIAARNPTATLLAAELHPHRAELLRGRVRAENVQVIAADALQMPLRGKFDRVLADVPCSGTGTLARNPEIKWRLKAEDFADLHARQVAILCSALQQLAPGGRLVYSTCSLERDENESVVAEAISHCPGLDSHNGAHSIAHSNSHDVGYRILHCGAELKTLHADGEIAWSDVASLVSGDFLRTIPGLHPCDGFCAAILERTA